MRHKNFLLVGMGALVAGIATILFLKKRKEAKENEKPPKNAPQLDIENPGTQSEFPSSATESQVG